MWSDTLLRAEQLHLLRLGGWGVLTAAAGVVLALLSVRARDRAPLLRHFATQLGGIGGLVVVAAAWQARGLGLRDLAAAVALDRMSWLAIGISIGVLSVGATLLASGWLLGRRLGLVGAGLALVVHGVALAALHLVLANQIVR